MSLPKILVLSGSTRVGSHNTRLAALAAKELALVDADVTRISLTDYSMPIYDADLEKETGTPHNAMKLRQIVGAHQGVFIASPEYNASVTPLLKNTVDWCSRADDNPFTGKVAAVVSASPGQFGGVRSLKLAQQLLLQLGCHIVPAQCFLSKAHEAFDDKGALKEARNQKAVEALATALVKLATKLA